MKRTIFAALILFAGCTAFSGMPSEQEVEAFQKYLKREHAKIDSTMKSFEGKHFFDMLAEMGPHDEEMEDGQGGKILIWKITLKRTAPGQVTTYSIPPSEITTTQIYMPETTEWEDYRMAWVDKNGIVYKTAWKGLGVSEIPAQIK